jgi:hypothetical protein
MLILGAGLVFGSIKLGQYSDSLPKIEPTPYHEEMVPGRFGPMTIHTGGTDRGGESRILDFAAVLIAVFGGASVMAGGYDIIRQIREY